MLTLPHRGYTKNFEFIAIIITQCGYTVAQYFIVTFVKYKWK